MSTRGLLWILAGVWVAVALTATVLAVSGGDPASPPTSAAASTTTSTVAPTTTRAPGTSTTTSVTTPPTTAATTTVPSPAEPALPAVDRPNIVLIVVDDLRPDELELGFGRALPGWDSALERELVEQGTMLPNTFITTPLCCPSRASILTGTYAHTHLVLDNSYPAAGGYGGYPRFYEDGWDAASLGALLHDAGYHTGMVGKYMNGFPNAGGEAAALAGTYIPPGWDEWYATRFTGRASYYQFSMNENGTEVAYGADAPAYLTDVQAGHAVDFLRAAASGEQPFFLLLSPNAPHFPMQPAPRHDRLYDDLAPVPPPSLGEADLGDKPAHVVAGATSRTERRYQIVTERTLDLTLALDEMIGAVFRTLEETGRLEDTYVVFLSDNGLLRGEHGIGGKGSAYEEVIRAPLLVRGPGVAAGAQLPHLAANIDVLPTVLGLAGVAAARPVDGESLLGVLAGEVTDDLWRDAVLVEMRISTLDVPALEESVNNAPLPRYHALRTRTHVYIEYETGETELYDLRADPFQLESIPAAAAPDLVAGARAALRRLVGCAGADCAAAARGESGHEAGFVHLCRGVECELLAVGAGGGARTWEFGDGATAAGPFVVHRYAAPGEYRVVLEDASSGVSWEQPVVVGG